MNSNNQRPFNFVLSTGIGRLNGKYWPNLANSSICKLAAGADSAGGGTGARAPPPGSDSKHGYIHTIYHILVVVFIMKGHI